MTEGHRLVLIPVRFNAFLGGDMPASLGVGGENAEVRLHSSSTEARERQSKGATKSNQLHV